MMKKFLMVFCLTICTVGWMQEAQLPNVKLKDLDNKKVGSQTIYKDGPVLINFWSLSCEPCKKEMKFLDKFNKKYEKQGFKVVSVNIDNPRSMAKVKSYIKSKKFSFQVLSDPKSQFFRKVGGKVMPFTLLVDKNGVIVLRRMGYNPGDEIEIENDIIELIKAGNEKPEETPAVEEAVEEKKK